MARPSAGLATVRPIRRARPLRESLTSCAQTTFSYSSAGDAGETGVGEATAFSTYGGGAVVGIASWVMLNCASEEAGTRHATMAISTRSTSHRPVTDAPEIVRLSLQIS
ncbi:hypothetical protein CC85DRAFT_205815 [Cutaneotrichosporon oleaginosum]|uniref:Uncharacterized protein n=1 Tax=Cutaneotrichosporon oleaginosum TaxID=879819 RepID=A0A0J0XDM0_9TREE|nr:uncharacterized protein CC85DRAFT_205815 [Cutaneotrichosporon oleaginosum]KLT39162.1 hypothetical protein CC85DRAFT_205815 [Cutaneotrichosporon oleaginosum]TXT05320.1 hypothetical protein COLE_06640 [Cutaneotrichosporon oleaginosum]